MWPGLPTTLAAWKGSIGIFLFDGHGLNRSRYGPKTHSGDPGRIPPGAEGNCTERVAYLSRGVLYVLHKLLVFANFLHYSLVRVVFRKESVHVSLGLPGDQEVVLVVELEVLDGGCALFHDHFPNLFFVSLDNLIQNDWGQG